MQLTPVHHVLLLVYPELVLFYSDVSVSAHSVSTLFSLLLLLDENKQQGYFEVKEPKPDHELGRVQDQGQGQDQQHPLEGEQDHQHQMEPPNLDNDKVSQQWSSTCILSPFFIPNIALLVRENPASSYHLHGSQWMQKLVCQATDQHWVESSCTW